MPDDQEIADFIQPAIEVLYDIVVSEDCPKSQNEWGTHHEDWYEDEGCPWCGTTEPNLLIFGDESSPEESCDPEHPESVGIGPETCT